MAGETGPVTTSLIAQLAAEPSAFDFFQAVRRLECEHPNAPGLGRSLRAGEDPIRFGQEPSLAFAGATLNRLVPGSNGVPSRLVVNFLGLLGPNGPMPTFMTEYARERQLHHDDDTLVRFLDIFHHRMVSLFYRSWAVNQAAVNGDRLQASRFATYIGSMIGIGQESLRNRDQVQDLAKLHFAGHLACPTGHADGLQAILAEYFHLPTSIEQFVGQWIELPEDCRCRLGESPTTGLLGSTAIVGSRMWNCQQKFRVKFGPLNLANYERLLPGGTSFKRLRDWIMNYLDCVLAWDVQLVLKAEEVPRVQLGSAGRLGWTTWLSSQPFQKDADDLILSAA